MKAIVCEMCNSHDLVKQDGMFVCQHCGAKYTVEEAKKLLGSVTIDKTEETQKLLVLARRARDEQNIENAAKYYEKVLQEDPNNWEAAFFQVYFQVMQCKIIQIENAARTFMNSLDGTIARITEIEDTAEQDAAISTIIIYSTSLANMFASAAANHYSRNSTATMAREECGHRVLIAEGIFVYLVSGLEKYFATKTSEIAGAKRCYDKYKADYAHYYEKVLNESNGGCYVATAIYGSYDCPQVWTLRRFRDNTLAETWCGRAFIRVYYAISPTLVKWFGKTEWFKNLWKPTLDRMVENLNESGVEDTPYDDRAW